MTWKSAKLVSSISALESQLFILLPLQYMLTLILPSVYAFVTTLGLLSGIVLTNQLSGKTNSPVINPEDYVKDVKMGRWTAQPSDREEMATQKLAQEGIVCFVLGVSSNHPLGLQAPGFAEVGKYFVGMLKEAEAKRTEWGFLGGATGLQSKTPTGLTNVSLSYWKTVEGLHAFANSPVHREGWNWWNRNVRVHPYIGIMHEVYAAPPGAWENIYVNFKPFGIGETKSAIDTADGIEFKSSLLKADKKEWGSMLGRMGRLAK